MKRLIFWIVGVPAAIIVVALSVANRAPVTFSLDPVSVEAPFYSITLPLFVLLFAAAFVGLVIGWLVGWAGGGRRRQEARRLRREVESLKVKESPAGPAVGLSDTAAARPPARPSTAVALPGQTADKPAGAA